MEKGTIEEKNVNEANSSENLEILKINNETKETRHIIGTRVETKTEKGELYEYRNNKLTKENMGMNIGRKMVDYGSNIFSFLNIGLFIAAAGFITQKISSKIADEYVLTQKRKIIKSKEYLITYNIFSDKTEEEASRNFIKETIEEGNWEDIKKN